MKSCRSVLWQWLGESSAIAPSTRLAERRFQSFAAIVFRRSSSCHVQIALRRLEMGMAEEKLDRRVSHNSALEPSVTLKTFQ